MVKVNLNFKFFLLQLFLEDVVDLLNQNFDTTVLIIGRDLEASAMMVKQVIAHQQSKLLGAQTLHQLLFVFFFKLETDQHFLSNFKACSEWVHYLVIHNGVQFACLPLFLPCFL